MLSPYASWEKIESRESWPGQRWGHSVCVVDQTRMFLFGGFDHQCNYGDGWFFDTQTFEWSAAHFTGEKVHYRAYHSTITINNSVVLFGGCYCECGAYSHFNDIHVLDLKTLAWRRIVAVNPAKSPSPRSQHAAVLVGKSMAIIGGYDGRNIFGDTHIFNLETLRWRHLSVLGDALPSAAGLQPRPFKIFPARREAVSRGSKVFVVGNIKRFNGEKLQIYMLDIKSRRSVHSLSPLEMKKASTNRTPVAVTGIRMAQYNLSDKKRKRRSRNKNSPVTNNKRGSFSSSSSSAKPAAIGTKSSPKLSPHCSPKDQFVYRWVKVPINEEEAKASTFESSPDNHAVTIFGTMIFVAHTGLVLFPPASAKPDSLRDSAKKSYGSLGQGMRMTRIRVHVRHARKAHGRPDTCISAALVPNGRIDVVLNSYQLGGGGVVKMESSSCREEKKRAVSIRSTSAHDVKTRVRYHWERRRSRKVLEGLNGAKSCHESEDENSWKRQEEDDKKLLPHGGENAKRLLEGMQRLFEKVCLGHSINAKASLPGDHHDGNEDAQFRCNEPIQGASEAKKRRRLEADTMACLQAFGEKVYVHRALVGARSSFFKSMWQLPMQENRQGLEPVELRGVESKASFIAMIRYLYTGNIDYATQSPSQCAELLKLADQFGIDSLKDATERLGINLLSKDNVDKWLSISQLLHARVLEAGCVNFLSSTPRKFYVRILKSCVRDMTLRRALEKSIIAFKRTGDRGGKFRSSYPGSSGKIERERKSQHNRDLQLEHQRLICSACFECSLVAQQTSMWHPPCCCRESTIKKKLNAHLLADLHGLQVSASDSSFYKDVRLCVMKPLRQHPRGLKKSDGSNRKAGMRKGTMEYMTTAPHAIFFFHSWMLEAWGCSDLELRDGKEFTVKAIPLLHRPRVPSASKPPLSPALHALMHNPPDFELPPSLELEKTQCCSKSTGAPSVAKQLHAETDGTIRLKENKNLIGRRDHESQEKRELGLRRLEKQSPSKVESNGNGSSDTAKQSSGDSDQSARYQRGTDDEFPAASSATNMLSSSSSPSNRSPTISRFQPTAFSKTHSVQETRAVLPSANATVPLDLDELDQSLMRFSLETSEAATQSTARTTIYLKGIHQRCVQALQVYLYTNSLLLYHEIPTSLRVQMPNQSSLGDVKHTATIRDEVAFIHGTIEAAKALGLSSLQGTYETRLCSLVTVETAPRYFLVGSTLGMNILQELCIELLVTERHSGRASKLNLVKGREGMIEKELVHW
eukprot:CAMPEP_0184485836 /NCGR_PEP_ID=MMETSP0113_2-20130426/7421_1 /TAXON_ID=91329 /ORGANISM="Norrisiella sphaerica, Strain BC52" /LENGTH=1257 /DNA_ID=CAMNT_0026867481 /DNA_START=367 /DNA_END=4137 /DNA_ORIENTATION=+